MQQNNKIFIETNFLGNTVLIIGIGILLLASFTMFIRQFKHNKEAKQSMIEAFENSPKVKKLRAKEAKYKREIAQKRRLRAMGIGDNAAPYQKNDLLNAKFTERETTQIEDTGVIQQIKSFDYRAELAAYNKKLEEVQAEELRLRAAAKAKAEQERLVLEKQKAAKRAIKKNNRTNSQLSKQEIAKNKKLKITKTEKNTLQITRTNFGSYGSFKVK